MAWPLPDLLDYQLEKSDDELITENRYATDAEGSGCYELLSPDGMHFFHYLARINDRGVQQVHNRTAFVQLNFSLRNRLVVIDQNDQLQTRLNDHEYNIIVFPPGQWKTQWEAEADIEHISLNLSSDIFDRNVPSDHVFHLAFDKALGEKGLSRLSPYNLPVTPRINAILIDILHCPLEQRYKRLFLKAKVIELLMLLFSHHEEYRHYKEDAAQGLQESDIGRMQQAREILLQNIQNPCSLIDLAHQVGTNDNYLKKQFKQVFGQTVYGYVQEVRMQEAKRLLADENIPLAEIARLTGYKHTHHFVAAFRRYFGYAPPKRK